MKTTGFRVTTSTAPTATARPCAQSTLVQGIDQLEESEDSAAHSCAWPRRAASLSSRTQISLAIGAAILASRMLAAAEPARQEEPTELTEVTITGSRIQQVTGMTTPTPVAALSAEDLTAMSPGNITQALTELPQFYGSATAENFGSAANGFFASAGGGSLNLRGVGSKRTLTLLDGRRVVPVSLYGGPDINMFPKQMLKRVETVTGGASAAYGTDAVSGVVNYLLDTKFTGIKGHVQGGQTSRGDGENSEIGLSMGHEFGNGLHVLFAAERFKQASIESFDGRDWYRSIGLIRNPNSNSAAATGTTAAINTTSQSNPLFILAEDVRSMNASYDGVITAWQARPGFTVPASYTRSIFNSDGSVSPFINGNYANPSAGSHSVTGNAGSGTDNLYEAPNLLPRNVRSDAFVYLDKDFGSNLNVYVQGMYGDQSLRATNTGGAFHAGNNQPLTIHSGNPFLPATLQARMTADNIASFTFGRIGDLTDIGGDAYTTQATKSKSATAGFKAKLATNGLFNEWSVDGYAQYGKSSVDAAQEGGIRLDRIFLALDAVQDSAGRTVCNVTLVSGRFPDCVPLNLFGRGNASQAAINWVTGFDPGVAVTVTPYFPPPEVAAPYSYISDGDKHRVISMDQKVAELVTSGKLFDGWGAGPVSMALGGHYRKETMVQNVQAAQGNPSTSPDYFPVLCNDTGAASTVQACASQVANQQRPVTAIGVRGVPGGAQNNNVEFQFSKVPFARGAYDVKELFTEFNVPLLADLPLLKQLTFNAAARWASYGGSGNIWAYKGGIDSQFNNELRLRGTYSRDVRAANFGERFDRTGGLTGNIFDYSGNPPVRNSTAVSPAPFLVTGGNPNVQPEKGDTFTVGLVYRPEWFDGFDMSVDYLSVKVKGAIGQYGQQDVIDGCFLRNDQALCDSITRDSAGNILILSTTSQNINQQKISGIDAEMGYSRAIEVFGGGERVGLRVFTSYLQEQSFAGASGVKTDSAGNVTSGLPKWKSLATLTYSRGDFRSSVSARYVGGGRLSNTWNAGTNAGATVWDVADNHVGSITYVDARASYQIGSGSGNVEVFGNVNNLFDRDPPVIPVQFGGLLSAAGQYSQTNYDVIGRRFVIGVNVKF